MIQWRATFAHELTHSSAYTNQTPVRFVCVARRCRVIARRRLRMRSTMSGRADAEGRLKMM